jgi:hypothetical protein
MRVVVVVSLLAFLYPAASLAQGAAPAPPVPEAAPGAPLRGGGITRDQFIERAKERAAQHFDQMDTNHDGVLSPEERRAARAERRDRRATSPQ